MFRFSSQKKHSPQTRKGVRTISDEVIKRRIAEAWALIRKGDKFGIGRRFLSKHGVF
ncbi:hypothetical protein [Yoonia vestfoldensis]|uniref:Uncharacterized protein n=1 Tax=Yoonia vestfoldensis TaxID=245188 RepID=A0A1Y0E6Y3_9RHOB|nr:hypothetical protein [Yoonia vestfoldensis]ART99375.1 hypothetical protein LOKVESSMR4R_00027 [Yoonia vestfoldensis]